jgi:hypothetical protein
MFRKVTSATPAFGKSYRCADANQNNNCKVIYCKRLAGLTAIAFRKTPSDAYDAKEQLEDALILIRNRAVAGPKMAHMS